MSFMAITHESLSKQLDRVVPEMYVIIAKNSIQGLDEIAIAELLGVSREEIAEVTSDSTYKDARLILATEYAKVQTEKDFSWDDIESQALGRLSKRVGFESDTETLLKIAATANKAQRRNQSQATILDPTQGTQRVALTLTSRIVKRLGRGGEQTVEETKQISVTDGSAVNPSFQDIDEFLGVTKKPILTQMPKIQTRGAEDFDLDDLEFKG